MIDFGPSVDIFDENAVRDTEGSEAIAKNEWQGLSVDADEKVGLCRKIEMLNEPSDSEDEFIEHQNGTQKTMNKPPALPDSLFYTTNENSTHQYHQNPQLTTVKNCNSIQNDYHFHSNVPHAAWHSNTKKAENLHR